MIRCYTVEQEGGGHMRPCAKLVKSLKKYTTCDVQVFKEHETDAKGDAKSIMFLLGLQIHKNNVLCFETEKINVSNNIFEDIDDIFKKFF